MLPAPGQGALAVECREDRPDVIEALSALDDPDTRAAVSAERARLAALEAWLWKHKPLHDAEALVLAHLPGQGRLAGQLGALQVRTESGVELAIGSGFSDADRQHPPAVGQRISFTHRGFTAGGVPRFASYLRPAPAL